MITNRKMELQKGKNTTGKEKYMGKYKIISIF